jgi:hypothetical protein
VRVSDDGVYSVGPTYINDDCNATVEARSYFCWGISISVK